MSKSIRTQQELPAQLAPNPGVKQIFDIPLTSDIESLIISFSGSVQLTTGATQLNKDGIAEFIQSVDLIANGSDTICSVPFPVLVQGNLFRRKGRVAPTLLQPLLTVAVQPFSCVGVLDLAAFGAIRPKDSSVREFSYKTLQLALRYATDWTPVFNGGGFVTSAIVLTTIVMAQETVEIVDSTGKLTAPILRPLFSYREDTVTGAVTRERFRLTPEQALRGITFRAVNATGVTNSDTVLSRVRIYTGKTLRFDKSAAGIRAQNLADMNATIPTGYYYIDLASSGNSPDRLNDCYDLRAAVLQGADAYIEFDSSAAMTAGITQWGYTRLS
jgi:hypothetical protein